MSTATVQPVPSGLAYVVVDVDGHPPRALDDFTGPTKKLLLRRGPESSRIAGSGATPLSGELRFHQKDHSLDGRDVRVWSIKNCSEGTFYAEAWSIV